MKKSNGHLKERNHFDSKDIALLVITMIVIYGIFSWFANGGKTFDGTNPSNIAVTTEASQSEEASQEN